MTEGKREKERERDIVQSLADRGDPKTKKKTHKETDRLGERQREKEY
jgi:hypothetical protein